MRVLLPGEIEGVIPEPTPSPTVDLEQLDFFSGRRFVNALLDRENHCCFYCLKSIRVDSCELDHAISRVHGVDHSYRNIVAACHDCNTQKQESGPVDFLRILYRKGRLSPAELENRLAILEQLQSGKLVLNASLVAAAI